MNAEAFTHHLRLNHEPHRIGRQSDARRIAIHGPIEPIPAEGLWRAKGVVMAVAAVILIWGF